MHKKITIFCFGFDNRGIEAISKEIISLKKNLGKNIFIYNLSLKFMDFQFRHGIFGYYYKFLPLLTTIPIFSIFTNISHIYTSVNDMPYMRLVMAKNIILTSVEGVDLSRLKLNIDLLRTKINRIVVQSEGDKDLLIKNGVIEEKINVIYPGVDLSKYVVKKNPLFKKDGMKILFASSPLKEDHFKSRGVDFILKNKNVFCDANAELTLLWRDRFIKDILKKIWKINGDCIKLKVKDIHYMNKFYQKYHATIIPYSGSVGNKPCPNSLIESLASGIPVLVSEDVGVSDLIEREKCGVIFKLTKESLRRSIEKLRNNYSIYQSNTRRVAYKYFDEKVFLLKYRRLYTNMNNDI